MSELVVKSVRADDGTVGLVSPGVGLVRELAQPGDVIVGGRPFAVLETLGQLVTLVAPEGCSGRVIRRLPGAAARTPVGFGTELVGLDPRAGASAAEGAGGAAGAESTAALVFRAPMSGRFYARSAPTKPPMVEVGQILELGQTVCLLEVMKTFNRVAYTGADLPPRARVTRIVPADGEDVARGSAMLELEIA